MYLCLCSALRVKWYIWRWTEPVKSAIRRKSENIIQNFMHFYLAKIEVSPTSIASKWEQQQVNVEKSVPILLLARKEEDRRRWHSCNQHSMGRAGGLKMFNIWSIGYDVPAAVRQVVGQTKEGIARQGEWVFAECWFIIARRYYYLFIYFS